MSQPAADVLSQSGPKTWRRDTGLTFVAPHNDRRHRHDARPPTRRWAVNPVDTGEPHAGARLGLRRKREGVVEPHAARPASISVTLPTTKDPSGKGGRRATSPDWTLPGTEP